MEIKSNHSFLEYQKAADVIDIINIEVESQYRRQGLATALMSELIENNRDCEVFLEVRESNTAAIKLYKKFGFKEINRRIDYYDCPIEDGIMMKRSVDKT